MVQYLHGYQYFKETYHLYPTNGGNIFLHNVGNHLPRLTAQLTLPLSRVEGGGAVNHSKLDGSLLERKTIIAKLMNTNTVQFLVLKYI